MAENSECLCPNHDPVLVITFHTLRYSHVCLIPDIVHLETVDTNNDCMQWIQLFTIYYDNAGLK